MYVCKFCNQERKNNNSLKQHEVRCKLNPNKIASPTNFSDYYKVGHKGNNQYIKSKKLGIDAPILSEETRRKLGDSTRGKNWSTERKDSHSKIMSDVVFKNPDSYNAKNVCGRVKNIEVIDGFGNTVTIKGSWEHKVANELNKNNLKWTTVTTGFEYEWENKIHLYFPDFYLPEHNIYIEVKGYQRDRDLEKWKQFKGKLVIFKLKEIKNLSAAIPSLL